MVCPALVVLAAGVGRRYGGLKQMEPVDEYGNFLMDYSIHDALEAGFSSVVFIIKKEIEHDFLHIVAPRIERVANVHYVYQEIDMLPSGYCVPAGRVKPWGTSHALLQCKDVLRGPFAVINADDYYGRGAYAAMCEFLRGQEESLPRTPYEYAVSGYAVENTLTAHGSVTRAICAVDNNGYLSSIEEIRGISQTDKGGIYTKGGHEIIVPNGTIVSMNMWGFDESVFPLLESGFNTFLDSMRNPLSDEYLLPTTMELLMETAGIHVKVLNIHDKWFGVTYREDMASVKSSLRNLREQGVYLAGLWR